MSRRILSDLERLLREIAREEISDLLDENDLPITTTEDETLEIQKRKVRRQLIDRGYVLELQTSQKLVAQGWESSLEQTHWDLETESDVRAWEEYRRDVLGRLRLEKKEREIDIVATKEIDFPNIQSLSNSKVELVFECKRRTKEHLAFFLTEMYDQETRDMFTEHPPLGRRGDISTSTSIALENHYRRDPDTDIQLEHWISNDVQRAINSASHHSSIHLNNIAIEGYTLFGKDDDLRNSCMKVLDATLFQRAKNEFYLFRRLEEQSPIISHWTIYPIIVFDGPLWSVLLTDDDFDIQPIDMVSYMFMRNNYEFLVDIVRSSYLDQYLELLNQEIQKLEDIASE